jgi:hypothetical protein
VRVGRGDFSRSRRAVSLLLVAVAVLVLLRRRKRDWVFCENEERVGVREGCGRDFGGEGVVRFAAVVGCDSSKSGSGDRERAWRFRGVGRMLEDAE